MRRKPKALDEFIDAEIIPEEDLEGFEDITIGAAPL